MYWWRHGYRYVFRKIMEISKPLKGKKKRKLNKMPFTVKGYLFYYSFFWIVIISLYLAHLLKS
jgi:hypothetical protein